MTDVYFYSLLGLIFPLPEKALVSHVGILVSSSVITEPLAFIGGDSPPDTATRAVPLKMPIASTEGHCSSWIISLRKVRGTRLMIPG